MSLHKGYVYLLQSPTKYWKIGKTNNPDDRRKTFEVKMPFEVEYAHLIPCYDMHKLEGELHSIFAAKRVKGEWFGLDAIDINWIKAIESQVHFDVLLTTPNPYIYRGAELVKGKHLHKMERELVTKAVLYLLLIFTLLGGALASRNEFMTLYVGLPVIIASFALLVSIGSDLLKLYGSLVMSGTSK